MKRFKLGSILAGFAAIAVAGSGLLVPDSAAADQALFRVVRTWLWQGGTWGHVVNTTYTPSGKVGVQPSDYLATYILPKTAGKDKAPPAQGYIGKTTIGGKAAQKFTVPKGALRDAVVLSWYCKPGTCYQGYIKSGGVYTETQGKGWFAPNNPTGPTMTTTFFPASMTTTFPYFRYSSYTTGGLPAPSATYRARGNYDNPQRGGSFKVWPGDKRFGGTMRWLYGPNGFWVQTITRETPWLSRVFFPATQWQRTSNDAFDWGERESVGYGYRLRYTGDGNVPVMTPTPGGGTTQVTFKAQYIQTGGPWTTGKVMAYQSVGTFVTTLTFEGYDNRSVGGVGNLSMVTPRLRHSYVKRNDGSPVEYAWAAARVNVMSVRIQDVVTPEPGAVLMLGAGIMTLAGLTTVWRRRR